MGCVIDLLGHDSAVTRKRATPGRGRRVKGEDEHHWDNNRQSTMLDAQGSMPKTVSATPAMRQYLEAKRQYRDAIVFFRMGDFYEMFYEDALVASRALELTL